MENTAQVAPRRIDRDTVTFLSQKMTTETIRQDLSAAEIAEMQADHTADMIRLKRLEKNKKAYLKKVNEEAKTIKDGSALTLEFVENKYIERPMEVYNVADDDRRVIEWYTARDIGPFKAGDKVGERPMFADERATIKF